MVEASQYAELQTLCRRSFPERLEQRVSRIRPVGQGRHPAVAFALSWREGRSPRVESLLVRRYADACTWWSVEDRGKAQREWEVVRWLYAHGYPVMTPYASGVAGDQPYLLTGDLRGRALSLASEEGAMRYVEAAIRALAHLHRLVAPAGVRQALADASVGAALAHAISLGRACGAGDVVEACDALGSVEVEVNPLCVVHGDLEPDRVFCDAQGVTAIVGWEQAAHGDLRWDVARVALALRAQQADALVERLYASYEAQSDVQLQAMPFWEALSAVQRWATAEWAHRSEAAMQIGPLDEIRASAWRALTRLQHQQPVTS
jgi:aminoglycoside phosphotransferase (APT) family kinase protein